MGSGFGMLMSDSPLGVVLGVAFIGAIAFFIYLMLQGDKPDKPK